jgi:AcrR family transcriptional regulator
MPTVPKTSPEAIVEQARRLIARSGAEALSLQVLAAAVGVKAPSLYKHFESRASILRAVAEKVRRDLASRQLGAAAKGPLEVGLKAIARAQREYAREEPHLYALVFSPGDAEAAPVDHQGSQPLEALFALLTRWMGPAHVLEGARLLVAFTHGFAMMERSHAFQLGGDVDAAFEFGLDRVLRALRGGGSGRRAKARR